MKKIWGILVLVLIFCNVSFASTEKATRWIFHNVMNEHIACSTYFQITADALNASARNDLAKKNMKFSRDNLEIAISIAENIAKVKFEAVMAIAEKNMKEQMEMIDNKYRNLAILEKKYSNRCLFLMRDQKAFVDYYTKKYFE